MLRVIASSRSTARSARARSRRRSPGADRAA
jgi:hypothetical protein